MPTVEKNAITRWGSIIIAFLLLTSGAAFFIYSNSSNGNSNDDSSGNNSNNTDGGIAEVFISDEIEGKVTSVFFKAIVAAVLDNPDKLSIDGSLRKIENVVSLNSEIGFLSPDSNSQLYRAEVVLQSGSDRVSFAQSVFSSGLFDSPEIFFQASVLVPKNVNAQNEQGVSKVIILPDTQILGFVSPSTQEDNTISGNISIVLQNNQVVQSFLIESQNVSLSPVPISSFESGIVSSLLPSLTITGAVPFSPSLSIELLETELSLLNEVEGVKPMAIPEIDSTLTIVWNDGSGIASDLNEMVSQNSDMFSSFAVVPSGFEVELANTTVSDAKSFFRTKMDELTLTNNDVSFVEPITQIWVDMNTSQNDTSTVYQSVKDYFDSHYPNSKLDIFQDAWVSLDRITIPDSNQFYPIDSGQIPVSLFPGHSLGDIVFLQVNAIVVQGEIVSIAGMEKVEQTE